MTPRHHPGSDWLLALGAGTLDEAQGTVVAAHVEWCPGCRAKVAWADAIGGALLAGLPPTAMSPGAFDRLLQRMAGAENLIKLSSLQAANGNARSALPLGLEKIVPQGIDALPWKWLGPGVRGVRLPAKGRTASRLLLLQARPGTPLVGHTHRGNELTLVLRGAYSVNGVRFGPGDSEDSESGSYHKLVADRDEGCLCLLLIEGGIRPDGILAKIVQRFIAT